MPSERQPPREALNASGQVSYRKCKFCGKEFIPARPWQRFCSSAHRASFWNIENILKDEAGKDETR